METNLRKYHWSDDDVVFILSREYLENDIQEQEFALLNEQGKLTNDLYEDLNAEINNALFFFLHDCYSNVLCKVKGEKKATDIDYAF